MKWAKESKDAVLKNIKNLLIMKKKETIIINQKE